MTKPRLIYFQAKYDGRLPSFLLQHTREHVACLGLFFDVTLINTDVDYQQVCDRYEPDLVLFESGVNHTLCRRSEIRNIKACPEVPRIGLHHGDGFCNARGCFIGDMERWEIETYFTISTTTPDHTPAVAKGMFSWPVFIDAAIHHDYGLPKAIPILFTGNKNSLYPWRRKVLNRLAQVFPTLVCPHPGYEGRVKNRYELVGEKYARMINASWFVPACGTVAHEAVRKHFEVPGNRSCLIAEKCDALEAAGFLDMVNCVLADDRDVLDKVDYLLSNLGRLNEITDAGYRLAHEKHTAAQRDQILQWYLLQKSLRPGDRIIQENPFGPLAVARAGSNRETIHVSSGGLHLQLLRRAGDALSQTDWQTAETLLLECMQYMPWMPEPKVKLALSNLLKGRADHAKALLETLLEFAFGVYGAHEPDPVEWAYFILAHVCLGDLVRAEECSREFSGLSHPELRRVRRAVSILTGHEVQSGPARKVRPSLHEVPAWTSAEWARAVEQMLAACGQRQWSGVLAAALEHAEGLDENAGEPGIMAAPRLVERATKKRAPDSATATHMRRRVVASRRKDAVRHLAKALLLWVRHLCGIDILPHVRRRENPLQ